MKISFSNEALAHSAPLPVAAVFAGSLVVCSLVNALPSLLLRLRRSRCAMS